MNRYQILIEYVGTNYSGWQIQKKGKTIQGKIQKVIAKILKEKVNIIGSGRTDSGVHALEQSAHFDTRTKIKNSYKFLKSVNHFLSRHGISILDLKKRKLTFHARYSAKARIYKYVILNRKSGSTLKNKRCWHIIKKLNLAMMKKGAKKLIGTKDFSTFRSSSCSAKTPVRTIKSIKFLTKKDIIEIEIKAQSFLQNQVRSMVGCLKYVGEDKWSIQKFDKIIKSKKRINCAPPAPAEGLYLTKVIY
jgi:tRNA pseudouridine38-40 synthase